MEGGCHDVVEEIQEISDIKMVLLTRMLLLLLHLILLLTRPVVLGVLLQNLVLVHLVVSLSSSRTSSTRDNPGPRVCPLCPDVVVVNQDLILLSFLKKVIFLKKNGV